MTCTAVKALGKEGVINRNKREVSFNDWNTVRRAGDFSEDYLHLDQGCAN